MRVLTCCCCAEELTELQGIAYKLQEEAHCHVSILNRVSVRSWATSSVAGSSGRLVDPHRWLSLAALVMKGSAVNEYGEPVLNIFGQMSAAVNAMTACEGVSGLLNAYCRLCHVTVMHREGSMIVAKLLDQKQQCSLLQASLDAWTGAVKVSVSGTESTLTAANAMHNMALQPTAPKPRASWRPYAVDAWQRCVMCLSLAHSYIALSNMTVASRGGQMSSSGPRLRREPSFAQLAGPDQPSSSSQARCLTFFAPTCPIPLYAIPLCIL